MCRFNVNISTHCSGKRVAVQYAFNPEYINELQTLQPVRNLYNQEKQKLLQTELYKVLQLLYVQVPIYILTVPSEIKVTNPILTVLVLYMTPGGGRESRGVKF